MAMNGGGPVGVDTLPRDAIEDIIEPFLIQKVFIQRTPRARLTGQAFRHIGLANRNAIQASRVVWRRTRSIGGYP